MESVRSPAAVQWLEARACLDSRNQLESRNTILATGQVRLVSDGSGIVVVGLASNLPVSFRC